MYKPFKSPVFKPGDVLFFSHYGFYGLMIPLYTTGPKSLLAPPDKRICHTVIVLDEDTALEASYPNLKLVRISEILKRKQFTFWGKLDARGRDIIDSNPIQFRDLVFSCVGKPYDWKQAFEAGTEFWLRAWDIIPDYREMYCSESSSYPLYKMGVITNQMINLIHMKSISTVIPQTLFDNLPIFESRQMIQKIL